MRTIWSNFLNLFFPNVCRLCKRPLIDGENQICLFCLCDLPRTNYHKQIDNPAEQLFFGKSQIEHATAYLYFEKGGKVQQLVHSIKYQDNKELGFILGRQMAQELVADASSLCDIDLMIPVPLHPKRMKLRGYNQAEWIARGIASVWGKPIDTNHLLRAENTQTQTRKTVYDRWENVHSMFKTNHPEALINKHILIIDDVITTGATLSACADALINIPDVRVSILALAIA